MRIYKNRSREIFNYSEAPKIIYEEQFDGFNKELKKLTLTKFEDIEENDLWYYLHDLAYMELQPDLFRYLFPACLDFWYKTLLTNREAGIGDSEFHYAVYRGNILEKMLTDKEKNDVLSFFIDGFLDKVDVENNLIQTEKCNSIYEFYNLIYRFNSLGYIIPIKDIWLKWWSIDSKGKAISIIKYSSGLIYESNENILFKNGYSSFMYQSDSQIYNELWLNENINFLRSILNSLYIQNKLNDACKIIKDSEIAKKIYFDSLEKNIIIDLNINYLLENLSLNETERNTNLI